MKGIMILIVILISVLMPLNFAMANGSNEKMPEEIEVIGWSESKDFEMYELFNNCQNSKYYTTPIELNVIGYSNSALR